MFSQNLIDEIYNAINESGNIGSVYVDTEIIVGKANHWEIPSGYFFC